MKFTTLLCLPLFLFPTVNAQQLGFSIDCARITTNEYSNLLIPISGFSVLAGVKLMDNLSVEARFGREFWLTEFQGWEISGYLNYQPFLAFYFSTGLLFHSNEGGTISNTTGVATKRITMFGLGVGGNISDVFSIELIHHLPLTKEEWYYSKIDSLGGNKHWQILTGSTKLNFKFSWDL